jgi:hypothetical protein
MDGELLTGVGVKGNKVRPHPPQHWQSQERAGDLDEGEPVQVGLTAVGGFDGWPPHRVTSRRGTR